MKGKFSSFLPLSGRRHLFCRSFLRRAVKGKMAAAVGSSYRTTAIEGIEVKEAAFHTYSNRFYRLEAVDAKGWPFPFEALHHRKVVVAAVTNDPAEIAALRRISDEIAPRDGTRIVAFPTEAVAFDGVHPNDASFVVMERVEDADTHPVFQLLKQLANVDAIQRPSYFYFNRNSHLQGVADSAEAILQVLQDELPTA
mmetsp:Transcript_28843/g.92900  ORF Transcript_28843/g.92900 Transcript_28843/m.92900 type:complete len:197 (-) Transcript_28843:120-710(-)